MPQQLTDNEIEVVNYILYVSSGLSVLGASFIILTYLLFSETRTLGTKLIFFLSVADLFSSFSWLPWNMNEGLCITQAVTLHFFATASFMWTLCICFSLFQVFYLEKLEEEAKRIIPFYHVISWGYPGATAILCLVFKRFGPAGSWCWIEDPRDPFRLFVYGLVTLVLIAIILSVLAITIKLSRSESQSDIKRTIYRRLFLYLLAFVASQVPALVNRIQNYFEPDDPQIVLFVLQAIFQPAQGLFNCIVYGFNETVFIEHYKILFGRVYFALTRRKPTGNKKNAEEIPIFDYDYASDED